MKNLIILSSLLVLLSCCTNDLYNSSGSLYLNFRNCLIVDSAYTTVHIYMPEIFKLKKIQNEGLCEYRLYFEDGSIAYVSSDVWIGSSLNFDNRASISHHAYNKKTLLDTVVLGGLQNDSLYWSEQIRGNISTGYVNATKIKKQAFENAFLSIEKIR